MAPAADHAVALTAMARAERTSFTIANEADAATARAGHRTQA
jgi:hypothetical protein